MRFALILAGSVAAVACTGEQAVPPMLSAAIFRQTDTVRFEAPFVVYQCDSAPDLVLQGMRYGNGVLVWLRPRDSLAAGLPIVGLRDTVTRPAAVVSVRYNHQSVLHSLSLDSGSVTLRDSAGGRVITLAGSGLDVAFGVRAALMVTFPPRSLTADSTTSCSRIK